jgi:hypothetical protein
MPGGFAPHNIDYEVTGRILVSETVRIYGGDGEGQDGGIGRQRPVAAGSVGRLPALERGDRTSVVGVPREFHVRFIGDPNKEAKQITVRLGGGDARYELVLQRERRISAGLLEFRHQRCVLWIVTVPSIVGRGAKRSAQAAGNEVMARNEFSAVDVEDQHHGPAIEHRAPGRNLALHEAILPFAQSGAIR